MRSRKRLTSVASLTAAGVLASIGLAVAGVSTQDSTVEQNATANDGNMGGAFEPSSLFIEVSTSTDQVNGRPSPTKRVQLDFDDSLKFTTQGLAQCTANLEGKTTQQARNLCASSRVGQGSADAKVGPCGPGPCIDVTDTVVTAFNGRPTSAGFPVILLHSRSESQGTTLVLKGILKPSPNTSGENDYGKRLDVNNIPPLAGGGGSLVRFDTTVKKSFRVNGNQKHFITAKCDDPDNNLDIQAEFTYEDGQPKDRPTDEDPC